ncbi:porin family protein [Zobellia uliginosa]|uniref:porin family protein n=1 Tax=Zobellia uliginosa TaxID=143224 RepID=UPI0026E285B5|nr:porin family protein [Zobellia uliginosa]MDO6516431.1 porin family protein [Zobellia uliginosa]
MKTVKLLIMLVVFCSTGMTMAQTRPGIKVGLNSSNISNTSLDTKSGVYIGAFADISLTDYYSLQPEILYSNQGGKSNSDAYGDVNINYISIGIPNKFYVSPDKGFHFILGLGLDINFDNNFVNLTNFNVDDEISPLDVVVFGGIGYEFDFGLILEVRYKQGTISVDFFGEDNYYEEAGSNLNGVFQIGAAYKFKL